VLAVDKQFRNMIIVNAVLILFYVFFNWMEYGLLSASSPTAATVQSHFPFYIQTSWMNQAGDPMAARSFNFTLLIFLIAIIANLRYIIRLQRT
jgi:hypothetical protein